ncbi:cell division protein PerM [Fodinicola feengrottensis]|uniref:cell division protein PerM n=1 Tax=Fodinicola feengrottensis TaxID=435914 RepID=UPI0031D011D6
MTDLLEPGAAASGPRTTGEIPKPDPERRPVPLWLAAVSTTGWAVLTGMGPLVAVILLVWVADSSNGSRAVDAFRVGIGVWLLAHGATLQVGGVLVGLAPLLVTGMAGWQVVRAGANAARAVGANGLAMGAQVVAAVASCYTVVGAVAAVAVLGSPAQVPVLPAVSAVAALGLLGSAIGVLRVPDIRRDLLRRFPAPMLSVVRAGTAAAVAVLGAGAVVAAAGMVLNWQRTVTLMAGLDDGPIGVIGLWVVCVLYVPTVAIWGASYVLGPGFAVGAGTHVGLSGVALGPLPAVPLLGGIPAAAAPWPAYALLALPVAAGVGAALMVRRSHPGAATVPRFASAALTGLVAGVLLAAAALAAGGPLGSARLAEVGPSGWHVGVIGGLEVALGAVGLVGFEYARDWALRRWAGSRSEKPEADPVDSADSAEQPTEPVQPVQPTEPIQSVEAEEPAEPTLAQSTQLEPTVVEAAMVEHPEGVEPTADTEIPQA